MNDRFDARVSLTGRSSDPRPKNPKREMSLTSRVFPSHLRHRARRRWHQGDQGRQEPHRGDRDRRRQGHLREGHLPGAGEGRRGPHRRGSPRPHGALNRHRRVPLHETKQNPTRREKPRSRSIPHPSHLFSPRSPTGFRSRQALRRAEELPRGEGGGQVSRPTGVGGGFRRRALRSAGGTTARNGVRSKGWRRRRASRLELASLADQREKHY